MPKKNPEHRFDRRFPNLKGTIFIVTYGRTGSTLLQNLLMTIPDCTIRGENHNALRGLFSATSQVKMTKKKWGKKEQPASHPWYGADAIRPNFFANAVVDAFVNNVLVPPQEARWFGFKEIRYHTYEDSFEDMMDFIRQNFKNAYLVFNRRSVEEVQKSAWWANWKPEQVGDLVQKMDQRFADYHAAHPEFTEFLQYETFSQDPLALKPLFDKLGETLDVDKIRAVLDNRLTH